MLATALMLCATHQYCTCQSRQAIVSNHHQIQCVTALRNNTANTKAVLFNREKEKVSNCNFETEGFISKSRGICRLHV